MRGNRKRLYHLLFLVLVALISTGSAFDHWYGSDSEGAASAGSKDATLKLVFAGDIMAHDVNYNRKPYDLIYQNIRNIVWEADLSFANLEFVFDPEKPPKSYPHFNAPVDYVKAAILGGFNVFSLANNHSLDMGTVSIRETLKEMADFGKQHRLYFNGTCEKPEQRFEPLFFEVAGVQVGFLAVTSFLNRHIDNEYVNVVPYYDEDAAEDFLKRLAAETPKSELFILSYHGGVEYNRTPAQWKRDLFKRCIESGVDIVWSHHPHVVQPWETVITPQGEKLIFYSTGNLISGQTWTAGPGVENVDHNGTGESALYTVEIRIKGGKVTTQRVEAIPICNYRDPDSGMVVKRFDSLSTVDMGEEWALYYGHRLRELEEYLVDTSSWDFVR